MSDGRTGTMFAPEPVAYAATMVPGASYAPPVVAAPRPAALPRANLVLINEHGADAGTLVIEGGPLRIGRKSGPPFAEDLYLDPNHAQVFATAKGLRVDDQGSLNGVFMRVDTVIELQHHDQFRVGQELLQYEVVQAAALSATRTEILGSPNPGYWGRVNVLAAPSFIVRAMPIGGAGILIGRDHAGLTFPDDAYVSGRHCQIVARGDQAYLEDLGSSNGTYFRLRRGDEVPFGSYLLIGQQLFRLDPPAPA